jgi:DNA-binding GntR family transcriptional regulator
VNGRLPRYHRIADALRQRIRDGRLSPGTRLANQRELAQDFGVTLMTLRQALEVLERENLISRRHGLGTFVSGPSVDYDILQLQRLAGDLSALGENVSTRVLGSCFLAPDRRVAMALRTGSRERVLCLDRLRLVGGLPMGLQRSYLPARLGEEVVRVDVAHTPLHRVLEFKLGISIERASESVSAIRLGRREARALGCRAGAPAFESERVSYDPLGAAVVFDRVFIPGDRFRITRELHYGSPPGPPPGSPGAEDLGHRAGTRPRGRDGAICEGAPR